MIMMLIGEISLCSYFLHPLAYKDHRPHTTHSQLLPFKAPITNEVRSGDVVVNTCYDIVHMLSPHNAESGDLIDWQMKLRCICECIILYS